MLTRSLLAFVSTGFACATASAAPTFRVTTDSGGGAGIPAGSFTPNSTTTLYFFVSDLTQATTVGGVNQNSGLLKSWAVTFEGSGTALSFSNASTDFAGIFFDTNLTPDAQGNEDMGSEAFANAIDIGDTQTLLGSVDVTIAANGNASNTDLWIQPAIAARDPASTLQPQLLILNVGLQPDEVVNNLHVASVEGPVSFVSDPTGTNFQSGAQGGSNPLVPEPATIALLLAGCAGVAARRHRA